jgi:hypothetical protein
MPNGRLVFPALLSNLSDAPYLGECCILYCLTRQPTMPEDTWVQAGSQRVPGLVAGLIAAYLLCGVIVVVAGLRRLHQWRSKPPEAWQLRIQNGVWLGGCIAGGGMLVAGSVLHALLILLILQMLPLYKRRPWPQLRRLTIIMRSRKVVGDITAQKT